MTKVKVHITNTSGLDAEWEYEVDDTIILPTLQEMHAKDCIKEIAKILQQPTPEFTTKWVTNWGGKQ